MDEAEVAKQKYIDVVLVGNLDAPNQIVFVVNSSIILRTEDDMLRLLEIKRENFSLLLADAIRYMSLAGRL